MREIGKFEDCIQDLDIIIGSDLLYFMEATEPLFKMILAMFEKGKDSLIFYMCMIRRAQETIKKLYEVMDQLKDEIEF